MSSRQRRRRANVGIIGGSNNLKANGGMAYQHVSVSA